MASISNTSSDMEHYLGCQLFDAQEREDRLNHQLQATQQELQELESRAAEYKYKYQTLDDALEAEQIKTNAERLAKEQAEETIAHHRAQVLKLRRDELTANKHCEAAEAEILNLREELVQERSKILAWGELSSRLQEDLRRAETSESTAYDQLETAKTKVSSLQQELANMSEPKTTLDSQTQDLSNQIQEAHQRATTAETALDVLSTEIKSKDAHLNALLEKYTALQATHSACTRTHTPQNPPGPTPSTTNTPAIRTPRPQHPPCKPTTPPPRSKHSHQKPSNRPITPTTLPPTPPKPVILRPSLATIQVEMFKPPPTNTWKDLPLIPSASMSTSTSTNNSLRWKFFWRLPAETLELLFGRCVGR